MGDVVDHVNKSMRSEYDSHSIDVCKIGVRMRSSICPEILLKIKNTSLWQLKPPQ